MDEEEPLEEFDNTLFEELVGPPAWADLERRRLCLRKPADLLAWLPYQLGFWPNDSLVCVALRRSTGTGERVGMVARTDLAIWQCPEAARTASQPLLTQLQREGAELALCAIYSNGPTTKAMRTDPSVTAALDWWQETPWSRPEGTFLIARDSFCCLECACEPCCPAAGQPLRTLSETTVSARQVYEGHHYAPSRQALVPDPSAPTELRRRASSAARRCRSRRPTERGPALLQWQRAMLSQWLRIQPPCEDQVPGGQPEVSAAATLGAGHQDVQTLSDPAVLGSVLAGLSDPVVRDAALVWSGTADAAAAEAVANVGCADEGVVNAVFSGRLRPDPRRIARAEQVLQRLSAHATNAWKPAVSVMRGWLAWWCADGARANILLEETLEMDPDLPLAQLLHSALLHGIPPAWVRAQQA